MPRAASFIATANYHAQRAVADIWSGGALFLSCEIPLPLRAIAISNRSNGSLLARRRPLTLTSFLALRAISAHLGTILAFRECERETRDSEERNDRQGCFQFLPPEGDLSQRRRLNSSVLPDASRHEDDYRTRRGRQGPCINGDWTTMAFAGINKETRDRGERGARRGQGGRSERGTGGGGRGARDRGWQLARTRH